MIMLRRRAVLGIALLAAGCFAASAEAQTLAKAQPQSAPGAAQEIVIGHVACYNGPVQKDAIELGAGAQVYIDSVNERGGIDGRKLRILTADDQFKPENTVRLITEMKGKAVALLPITGSANGAALVKANVLEIPLVGTIPSADIMREPFNKNIFHIRASDREQTERILEQLTTVGLNKIALLVPNNPFGDQSTKIAEAYLAKRNLKLAANAVYLLAGPKADVAPGLKALEGKSYQAVLMFGPPKSIAELVKALKTRGETAQLYALSYADSKLIIDTAGAELAHGVVISQVMPNLNNKTMPIVRQFREDYARYAKTKDAPTYFMIEGYISARLIVEAIRRSKDASPDGVRRGLESLRTYDLGDYIVDFSPTRHQGSSFVDLSVIGGRGTLVY
jgi:branched-chain amino acid transport system substrate-binding protein